MNNKLSGLIAATYTPLDDNGQLDTDPILPMTEWLITQGVSGLYVCGSTGEGMSLSGAERRKVAEAYVQSAGGRVPVIVHVGHNSLVEARQLADHAQQIGANYISATCPSYFRINDVGTLVDCMAEVAAGSPQLPFYYYHIPALTGSTLDMVEFLKLGDKRIPNLQGLKYTDTKLHEFQQCLELENGRFDVLWGCDEMLLGALATGAGAAIGSTYNIAAPLYLGIMDAFRLGDLVEARRLQSLSVEMIRAIGKYPFHAAMKAVLGFNGFDIGSCRLPQVRLLESEIETLRNDLSLLGYFEWSQPSCRLSAISS
ncbi:N-acetylneuraminate lyase [Planctomycetes bacterium CA13]|uniref:N-acetylneuraminate lyase n=1 Tax=Novipirellula herctigrandis TaxID=2527986 RepID=A0A5C5ZBF3_9BACT|nr:N-acetylneuraminate lyase [Planctomycetes bacterium CA13]